MTFEYTEMPAMGVEKKKEVWYLYDSFESESELYENDGKFEEYSIDIESIN